jgi:hypothetical protein
VTKPHYARSRTFALAVTGTLIVLLLAVFAASSNVPFATASLTLALLGSLVGIWLAARAMSARAVWARGCLVSGMLSGVVGIGLQVQDAPWSGRPVYPDDLDKAIGPLTNFLWAFAARIGIAAFVLAMILLAISVWLFKPPRRQA